MAASAIERYQQVPTGGLLVRTANLIQELYRAGETGKTMATSILDDPLGTGAPDRLTWTPADGRVNVWLSKQTRETLSIILWQAEQCLDELRGGGA